MEAESKNCFFNIILFVVDGMNCSVRLPYRKWTGYGKQLIEIVTTLKNSVTKNVLVT